MADADVIPIGGRGRPGRGSRTTPSSAARALAGAAPAAQSRPRKSGESKPKGDRGNVVREPTEGGALRAEHLADAVSDAAREVFGTDGWERRLAEWLAFLRRRLSGDYAVDEFGFDQEVTERFLLTALRPIAEFMQGRDQRRVTLLDVACGTGRFLRQVRLAYPAMVLKGVDLSRAYLDEAERCSRVALLDRGRLLALDEPGVLRASLPGNLLEVIVPDPRAAQAALVQQGVEAQLFGDRLHVWLDESNTIEGFAARVTQALGASSVRPITPSLEDVYIARLAEAEKTR